MRTKNVYVTFHLKCDASAIYDITLDMKENEISIDNIKKRIVDALNGMSDYIKERGGDDMGRYENTNVIIANVIIL